MGETNLEAAIRGLWAEGPNAQLQLGHGVLRVHDAIVGACSPVLAGLFAKNARLDGRSGRRSLLLNTVYGLPDWACSRDSVKVWLAWLWFAYSAHMAPTQRRASMDVVDTTPDGAQNLLQLAAALRTPTPLLQAMVEAMWAPAPLLSLTIAGDGTHSPLPLITWSPHEMYEWRCGLDEWQLDVHNTQTGKGCTMQFTPAVGSQLRNTLHSLLEHVRIHLGGLSAQWPALVSKYAALTVDDLQQHCQPSVLQAVSDPAFLKAVLAAMPAALRARDAASTTSPPLQSSWQAASSHVHAAGKLTPCALNAWVMEVHMECCACPSNDFDLIDAMLEDFVAYEAIELPFNM